MAARCRIEWGGRPVPLAARRLAARAVAAALAHEGLGRCRLSVLVVDEAESARLHGQHFGEPHPTDVMSFPDGSRDPRDGWRRLGDLAVCSAIAAREAAARGRPFAEEFALYVLHGCLHLLGYDDASEEERARMWERQRALLAELGINIAW
ncbi:MAG: rRNA maturation RNase YbeY [Planctomycetota bacterium]|nr:rRNA maturation RNase YbeY [Planctomycetota bacterium]MCX8039439.1 rRNA maturation RNase YbeY [Planctomycetota bacterium]MDW8373558.1 rRNA maturation RNase YbeY [Planctomycetota bacterium]